MKIGAAPYRSRPAAATSGPPRPTNRRRCHVHTVLPARKLTCGCIGSPPSPDTSSQYQVIFAYRFRIGFSSTTSQLGTFQERSSPGASAAQGVHRHQGAFFGCMPCGIYLWDTSGVAAEDFGISPPSRAARSRSGDALFKRRVRWWGRSSCALR